LPLWYLLPDPSSHQIGRRRVGCDTIVADDEPPADDGNAYTNEVYN
jgi:hypothetical protein